MSNMNTDDDVIMYLITSFFIITLNIYILIFYNSLLLCGKGGKKVGYFSWWWGMQVSAAGEGCITPKTEIAFPRLPHILFFVTYLNSSIIERVMQGSMQQLDHNSTTTVNNISWEKQFGFIYFKRHAWRL